MVICEYGCEQEAKYQFKNGKWCCSSHYLKCPSQNKKYKGVNNPFYGKKHSDENKQKCGKQNKGKKAWNKGIPRTDEEKEKISKTTKEAMNKPEILKKIRLTRPNFKKEKHPKWSGGYYNNNIPMYDTYAVKISYAEKCRRDPNDKNILQVTCAYCGKWFTPGVINIYERIRSLEGRNHGEQRLYCSEQCKRECPIFHQISYSKNYKPATSREVQPELRQMRFELDNYTCQRCNKHQDKLEVGLHCHHIEGIRWEPLESADLDKVITLCKDCHKEVHKIEGCNYNDMKCGN